MVFDVKTPAGNWI